MTLKEKVFKWFDDNPQEVEKTGYGSNAKLREAFPRESRKTLSMYKMQYKKLKEKEEKKSPEEDKPREEKPREVSQHEKTHTCRFNLDKEILIFAVPVLLFLLWLIIKPRKK